MDATTLYVIVALANGELRTVDTIPQPSDPQSCTTAAQRARYDGGWTKWDANCALRSKTLVIAR